MGGRWYHRGGGRWVPGRPTPGLQAALAARDVAERVLAEQARRRRQQTASTAEEGATHEQET